MAWWDGIDIGDIWDGIQDVLDLGQGIVASKQEKQNAKDLREQTEYEARVMENNALLSDYAAMETLYEGHTKMELLTRHARRMRGQAKVSIAASGLTGGDSGLLIRDIYEGLKLDAGHVGQKYHRKAQLQEYDADMMRYNAKMHRRFGRPTGMIGIGPLLGAASRIASRRMDSGAFDFF